MALSFMRKPALVYGGAAALAVVAAYAAITSLGLVNPLFLPSPLQIWKAAVELWQSGTLQVNIQVSTTRVLISYAIGCSLAVLVGSLMGWFKRFDYILNPFIQCIRPIPALAYIPLTILWFGIGEPSKLFVITLGSFVTCVINVIAGVKNVPSLYIEAAQTFGASKWDIFFGVMLPAATPYILTGMRVALATAWGVLVAAELIAAEHGLGYMLTMARRFVRTDILFVGLICIGALAFIMDTLIRKVEVHFTRWMERV